jgi:hypothetical protein
MNQEIPKPLRNALARQAVGEVHPSPDVLTSFLECTLPPVESEVVTHHLAQCAECREIVFLASDAAEDEVRVERELVAAAAASRVAPMPVYTATSRPAAAWAEPSRPRWTSRMRWALSVAAAALLVSGGLVLQFSRAGSGHSAAPLTVASNRPALASPEAQQNATAQESQEAAATPRAPEALARAAPHRAMAAPAKKGPAQTTGARNAADQFPPAPAVQPSPQTTPSQATAGAVGDMNSAMVPEVRPQSTFAESEAAQAVQRAAPLAFGKTQAGMHSVSAARPQWRIGPEGHLERSMAAGQWTRVLDEQPTTFHAVAVMGNDVWAGGNGGALFHSSDGGEHWSKVSLAADSNVETGAIVSIRFDDPQHGIVACDSGTRWATADGGVTWTTQ